MLILIVAVLFNKLQKALVMKKKSIILFLISVGILVTLIGCGGDSATPSDGANTDQTNDGGSNPGSDQTNNGGSNSGNGTQNLAPAISGTPLTTVTQGNNYSFVPSASDANGDSLSFTIDNMPGWATFNSQTGALTGTATVVGTTDGIVISVSDGEFTTHLAGFSLTVTAADSGNSGTDNQPPSISGTPATTAHEGESYTFAPVADDQDGDTLLFSVANKPDWLSFNESTGELSGTPQAEDVGLYEAIQISVSDGPATVDLASFNITVESTSALLSWTAPSTREDSSPLMLSELSGYKIYSGTDPDALTLLTTITDSSVTSYRDEGLSPATHYYAITAYDTDGGESVFSAVVGKTIN
jgi:hypothetical protein